MPFEKLFRSRKFLLAILDAIVSIITLLVTNHLEPSLTEEVLALIAIIQPVVVMVIYGIAYEDAAAIRAGGQPGGRTDVS